MLVDFTLKTVAILNILYNIILVDLSPTLHGSMLLLSTLILSSYSIIVAMLGCDWGLRMVINITCFKIPGSGFIFAASEYPSMTNKEIIQYTNNVPFTQAPIRVCLHGTNIDSRTILVTMYYCG